MYTNTRFSDILKGLSRRAFHQVVDKCEGDKYNKGFRCWDHFVVMLYAQLSGCKSLRELESGFNSNRLYHYHIGCREVKRSTLSDANKKRDAGVFSQLCEQLMQTLHAKLKGEMKDLLYLLDSTPISLKGLGYEWAEENANHRTCGLKVHMLYAPEIGMPSQIDITHPKVGDLDHGKRILLEKGATYVFDKGYYDYNWWFKMHQEGVYFVTRLKRNAGVRITKSERISEEEAARGIMEDNVIEFKNQRPGGGRINHYYGTKLRRVVAFREDNKPIVIVTNDFSRPASEIAGLYKKRWGIELFFKWLKQNLKIKRFLGRSENAVKIQIYTALIGYLLAYLNYRRDRISTNLQLWLVEIRVGLFQRPQTERLIEQKRRREHEELRRRQGQLAL